MISILSKNGFRRPKVIGATLLVLTLLACGSALWPQVFKQAEVHAAAGGDTAFSVCCQSSGGCRTFGGGSCPDGSTPVGCPCQIP